MRVIVHTAIHAHKYAMFAGVADKERAWSVILMLLNSVRKIIDVLFNAASLALLAHYHSTNHMEIQP